MIGGLLPGLAVSAEVIDDIGERHAAAAANGAYVAVLDQPMTGKTCPVCCRDEHGSPVAPALPASWPRTPVLDAEERCPACGAVAWDEVHPTRRVARQSWNEERAKEPTPIVVCRACGHEESVGAWFAMKSQGEMDPEELERMRRTAEDTRRRRRRAVLAEVGFPIYAAEGLSTSITGHGGGSSGPGTPIRVEEVTITQPAEAIGEQPRLRVETAEGNKGGISEYAFARRWLELSLLEEIRPPKQEIRPPKVQRSQAARALAWRSVDRDRRKLAARAERRERPLLLDGGPQSFAFLSLGERRVAVHKSAGLTVTRSGPWRSRSPQTRTARTR